MRVANKVYRIAYDCGVEARNVGERVGETKT
jgi:hypothetical protein